MRYLLAACATLALSAPAIAQHHADGDDAELAHVRDIAMFTERHGEELATALAADNRTEDSARDAYRNPAQTLTFFHVGPHMKVGEYAPGGGWYSRVLGNYLNEEGKLVGLWRSTDAGNPDEEARAGLRQAAAGFPAQLEGWTSRPAAQSAGYTLDGVPEAELGTFDRVLVVRMMHNLWRSNIADSEIMRMRALLKPGGILGIVQHRAPEGASAEYANGSKGYLRQQDVVSFVEALGFELVGSSEINANPADTADHPQGVWEMPPTLATKRAELENLGESDRMTLMFRKRP